MLLLFPIFAFPLIIKQLTKQTFWEFFSISVSVEQASWKWICQEFPPLGAQSSFCEQVPLHLQLLVVVKLPAEFAATTCFRSSVYKLRRAIQSSKKTLSQVCQEMNAERSLCTLFKTAAAVSILFLEPHTEELHLPKSFRHFKYWKLTSEWALFIKSNQKSRGQTANI